MKAIENATATKAARNVPGQNRPPRPVSPMSRRQTKFSRRILVATRTLSPITRGLQNPNQPAALTFGNHGQHQPRPRPSPLQLDSYEYSNYTPSQSEFSTPYTGGFPPKKQVRIDSHSALLSSPPYQPPPGRPESYTYHPPGHIAVYQKWWHPSWNMYFFLFAGIAFAMGHHFFYKHLDGSEATNQLRMLRYGAALSFLSKASLASAVILAFRQRVWMTVRRKMLTLAAVDSLFAAAEDMSAIFNFEVFKQARVAMVLALYIWCTPLVVILTSDTLGVRPRTMSEDTMCPNIRTLNFTQEADNQWRDGHKIDGLYGLSVSLWNATMVPENFTDPNFFDYWAGPSDQFEQIATFAAFQHKPVGRDEASHEICGMGYNCTFTINFTGPGYKCTELANGVGSTVKDLRGAKWPSEYFKFSDLAPTGNFTYYAHASEGEYSNPQLNETLGGGVPKTGPPFPPHLGALRTEPILWIGYAEVDNTTATQPNSTADPGWNAAYTPRAFGCEHYETKYEVLFNYTNQIQNTTVKRRDFLQPVIDTTIDRGNDANDLTMDNTTAIPESNYILPTDVQRYRKAMAYHSIGTKFRYFVNGTVEQPGFVANTKALQTKLIDEHNYLGVSNLMEEVQSFYEDIIISMFSNPRFISVVWANDTSVKTGPITNPQQKHPCTRERTDIRYDYHQGQLWAVYSVAIFLAIIGVAFGVAAVWEEGLVRNTRFSSIVAATRGPGLEKLPWGNTVPGSDHRPVAGARVGYGLVPTDPHAGGSTYGFGLEGDVKQRSREEQPSRTPTGLGSPFNRASRRWSKLTSNSPPPPNTSDGR
uniref:Formylmethionine deformylase-like protein n=1 Tax=Colletotrichum fructicola (strain Nara gc5) TaxID=1213859 RepID=L2FSB5_COLFN